MSLTNNHSHGERNSFFHPSLPQLGALIPENHVELQSPHTPETINSISSTHLFPLDAAEITIGRHLDNRIVLNHPQVSSYHACLVREGEHYRIVNRNNAMLYVNVLPETDRLLQPGDEIGIGPYQLLYDGKQLTQRMREHSLRIDALHLHKKTKEQVVLLNDLSLAIPACSFVAIVGSSGAGKSTLLDALSGLRPAQEGQVFYNGQDYYRHIAAFKRQLGYVPQDDIVHRDLTVERALHYAARLRLPTDLTRQEIQLRIQEVLDDVDLQEQRHLLIGRLSGGQRKRVSIALELLDQPGLFFLDEPTSGLDPGLDYRMMHLLSKLSHKGQTVVMVTHATSNISICDYICFLAHGGRLAYFGPPAQALNYFGTRDFAEIYSLLEPGLDHLDAPEQAEKRFKSSLDYQRYVLVQLDTRSLSPTVSTVTNPSQPSRCPNAIQQFLILSLRYLELLKNDLGNLLILALQAPVIALIIVLLIKVEIGVGAFGSKTIVQCPSTANVLTVNGLPDIPLPSHPIVSRSCERVEAFLKHNPEGRTYAAKHGGVRSALQHFIVDGSGTSAEKVLFILGFTAVLFGCVNSVREIVKEAAIYRRERAVNLGILPYMFSKVVVLALLCLLQSAILVLIINFAAPFHQGIFLPVLLEIYITISLTSLTGLFMGLAVSAIAPSTDRAMSFLPLILIPQVIFSGTVFPFTDWFTQVLAMLFAVRWSIGALGSTVGLHGDKLGGDKLFQDHNIYHGTLFSLYHQTNATYYLFMMWLVLVIMILFFSLSIALCLKFKDKDF